MNYSELAELLGKIEKIWFGNFEERHKSNPFLSVANGEIQCYSIEDSPIKNSTPPLVICVGINYGQGQKQPWLTPYLLRKKSLSLNAADRDWVEDMDKVTGRPIDPDMRKAVNTVLDNYLGNELKWRERGYASSDTIGQRLNLIKGQQYSYGLVAANFSPFLTEKMWSAYSTSKCASPLITNGPLNELHDLMTLPCFQGHVGCHDSESDFTLKDALWIFHGKSAVWPLFDSWIKDHPVTSWLLTPNLNRTVLNTGGFKKFWKNGREKI